MEQPRQRAAANSTPLTTVAFLERAATAYADCPSIVDNQTTYTWLQTHRRSLQVASSLSSIITRGHVVSVVGPNIPATYELHFANVTHKCGAPVVLKMLASNSPTNEHLEKPVQFLASGAPVPAPLLLQAESLGFRVSHSYGLTETAGFVVSCAWKPQWSTLAASERARLRAGQGVRTIGLMQMDVVDPERGVSVKKDGLSLGEIVFKGGPIMLGCLKEPTAESSCMREDGWFYTGDIGVIHPDGYLEVKDRSKDVIISGGENISSTEVESVLYSNPAISEAAVVARPDELWGETPCAFVCLKDELSETPAEEEIIEFCRTRLPHYMAPKTVVFKEELPKTSTGKVNKFMLRDTAKAI
ncbi:probable acyl-activating enzyme 5, peroxisomal [Herrania umbratica]|uniref:Probable acyl-activating enzyme 5, peroxisomal n=1 Tax=Herrania umbratica TaxID=108875 RepID=A0A6J1AAZ4_9ROSI|nr:probable acyl-activating enzyme 5, peroxisomal [Herrania umbratica]